MAFARMGETHDHLKRSADGSVKFSPTRHGVWSGEKAYTQYVEPLVKHDKKVDGEFYDAIKIA